MSSPMQAHFIELVQTTNQTAASPSPTYCKGCVKHERELLVEAGIYDSMDWQQHGQSFRDACIRAGSVEGTQYSWMDHILGGGNVECACSYTSKSALEDAAAVRAQFWEQLAFVADNADSVRTRRTGLRASTRILEVVDTIMAVHRHFAEQLGDS
ncbi:hypothetical protein R3P38DRAFT_2805203 [Favolaschia claudopus]|uniref:Uncharacterized protein n=1 Tax=Favolaschia claudopus TaxID=2862362 RepID=A0AAV9ZN73_9AGAR